MHVVVLVISRKGGVERWDRERTIWIKRSKTAPPWVSIRLIEGNIAEENSDKPAISESPAILKLDCEDSYAPGIYQKTIYALASTLRSVPNATYFIRTNLSTHICWPRLLSYLQFLDPQYTGVGHASDSWVPGWGIVMSRRVAEVLVQQGGPGSPEFIADQPPDDVQIGRVLFKCGIYCTFKNHTILPSPGYFWDNTISITDNVGKICRDPEIVFVRLREAPLRNRLAIMCELDKRVPSPWASKRGLRPYQRLRSEQLKRLGNITSQ